MINLRHLIVEKTLYHGTTAEKARKIELHGLVPQAGDFVSSAYDEVAEVEPLPELVFATEKQRISVAVTAATQHVANLLGKNFHDVSDQEFFNHAAILKIYDAEQYFEHRPEDDDNYRGEYPSTVEPGDYFTGDVIIPDEILTGNGMVRLLRRYGHWPRDYMFQGSSENQKRTLLIKHYLKKLPQLSKQAVVDKVIGLNKKDLEFWYGRDVKGYN